MSDLRFVVCDRCDHRDESDKGWLHVTFSTSVGPASVFAPRSEGRGVPVLDLCPSCAARFEQFLGPRNPHLPPDSATRAARAPKHGE